MNPVATIGYEGADLDSFLARIKEARVTVIVDVRAVAVSRRRGFSKTALGTALVSQGIEYVHLRNLGDPKDGREAARAGYMETFRRIFLAHLATDTAQQGLKELADLVPGQRACLLCYEADHSGCHRTLIIDALADLVPVRVDHLKVSRGVTGGILRQGGDPDQSRAAA